MNDSTFNIKNTTRGKLPSLSFLDIKNKVLGPKYELSVVFIGRDRMRALNRTHRGKDKVTDVLSFPTGETVQLGEMAISVERAIQQAELHAHTVLDELKILMLHGALHLSGLDHEQDRGQMKRIETKWRKHFGLVSGLIERTK